MFPCLRKSKLNKIKAEREGKKHQLVYGKQATGEYTMFKPYRMSDSGLDMLTLLEGSRNKAYLDSAGLPTIGVGHLIKDSEKELLVAEITDEQVRALLVADVKEAERGLNNVVEVVLIQTQVDALLSFIFNVGVGAFASSTMLQLINKGKHKQAAEEFSRWKYAGGVVVNGLIKRREREAKLYKEGVYYEG